MSPDASELEVRTRAAFSEFMSQHGHPLSLTFAVFENDLRVVVGGLEASDSRIGQSDPHQVFRVASLTKSFTAAAVLRLRDLRLLALNDPAARHVPELDAWRPYSPTIEELLSMSAGLPTDNPWADRGQGLAESEFLTLLAEGAPGLAGSPGGYEYSNLGYAILGAVVARLAGQDYAEAIGNWFLEPLGLTSTGFDPADFEAHLAPGYSKQDGRWTYEAVVGHGAFSPMGGILSTAGDMAKWMIFLAAGFRGDPTADSILDSRSRREMQRIRTLGPANATTGLKVGANVGVTGYGYGLRVAVVPGLGSFAGHTGGYPGFGAHMWWHPMSMTGVVVLANRTYLPVWEVSERLVLDRVSSMGVGESSIRASNQLTSHLLRLQAAVDELIDEWNGEVAETMFSSNMAFDQPAENLGSDLEELNGQFGPFGPSHHVEIEGLGRISWRRTGHEADLRISLLAGPEPWPRVQQLELAAIPILETHRMKIVSSLVDAIDGSVPDWPTSIPVDATVARAARSLLALASINHGPAKYDRLESVDGEEIVVRLIGKDSEQLLMNLTLDRDRLVGFELSQRGQTPQEPLVRDR